MKLEEFPGRLDPPSDPPLKALWQDAQGDWEGAHLTVQDETTREAAWVHAYLHRKEGDESNAAYWYSRASRPVWRGSLDEEWVALAGALLKVTNE